jgi:DNA-binding transcriptional LysR family regulator
LTKDHRPTRLPPPSLARTSTRALDANALELLARVIAAGSFAQAARELHLTRAAISRRVAQIEADLGQPLFARTTRALGLTEAGRRLATRARAVLDAAEQARRALRGSSTGLSGTLRITAVPSFGGAVLGPLLARFQAEHPALRLELMLTHRRVDLLREDVDVAFRVAHRVPQDWVAQPVLRFTVHAYARPRQGIPLASPAALEDSSVLLFGGSAESLTMRWQHAQHGELDVDIHPTCCADDFATLLAMARDGDGIAFAPDYCMRDELARRGLVDALPGWQFSAGEGDTVQALTLPAPQTPESARALVRFVRDSLNGV